MRLCNGMAMACLLAIWLIPTPLRAQATDGFHTRLIFPVVVDSASFTQSFYLSTLDATTFVVPTFYPADGSAPLVCPMLGLTAAYSSTRSSLRLLCPALPAGSQFGMLTVTPWIDNGPIGAASQLVAGFSRVSNAAGAGFAVEAQPWYAFTSAFSSVSGLTRRAASSGQPALQSNCFIGQMPSASGLTPTSTAWVALGDALGNTLGTPISVALVPGKLVRLLDVFAAVGAPVGDHANARMRLGPDPPYSGRAGFVAFCTVQDNTSFNADFRIAKAEYGACLANCDWAGPMDVMALRSSNSKADLSLPGESARPFSLPPGDFQDTHVFYFRHPDTVSCELRSAIDQPATYSNGMEMRLLDETGNVLAGGSGESRFYGLFLGDKEQRGGGANTRYYLQVERNGELASTTLDYGIVCTSGSGHTPGDLVRRLTPIDQF